MFAILIQADILDDFPLEIDSRKKPREGITVYGKKSMGPYTCWRNTHLVLLLNSTVHKSISSLINVCFHDDNQRRLENDYMF